MGILIFIYLLNIFHSQINEQIYKSILDQNYNIIFVFTDNHIYSYDSINLYKKETYAFNQNDQKLLNPSEAESISLASTFPNNINSLNYIYIIVKAYLYIFSKDAAIIKVAHILNTELVPINIIFYKCINDNNSQLCNFFIFYINSDKNLEFFKVKQTIENVNITFSREKMITYNLKNSLNEISQSKNYFVSCQIMKISQDINYFTCFYENNDNEIGTINFDIDELNEINSKPPIFRKNCGAAIIKSVLYSDNKKAFVCYINDNKDCVCLSFDIIKNEWSNDEYKYLENCNQPTRFFTFDFYKQKKEYILTCFISKKEFYSISFNSNMKLIEFNDINNKYCISNIEIISCGANTLFSIINYKTEYEIDISCSYTNLDQLIKMEFPLSCSISSNLICLNSDTCTNTECISKNSIINSDETSNDKNTNIDISGESNFSEESKQ